MKAHIVSLGCPKNLTDSEVLMGQLVSEGYSITNDPSDAEMIIVNTCAFLRSAREESLSVIKEMSTWKEKGKCQKLYVAGCLPKYDKKLVKDVDEYIDSIDLYNCKVPRIKATNPWIAYVKIAEGCDNRCSYCLIPSIRGKLRTRKIPDILSEVKALAKRGVKEIIFVAQDTTAFPGFPQLLQLTSKIKGIRWVRIMYTHPKHITNELIKTMAKEKKIVKYIDMPVQHANNRILKLMGRKYSRNTIEILLKKLRAKIPGMAIRTSLVVGFPGETEKDFNELIEFIEKARFDRLGVFPYSREKGTSAYNMKGQVPDAIKNKRAAELMEIQSKISKEANKKFVDKTLEVIIEGKKGKYYVGRTYRDAPEIDGKVFVRSKYPLVPRQIIRMKVTKAGPYDLHGIIRILFVI